MSQIAENAVDGAISQLDNYLGENVSELRRISREWPNPSYELRMPYVALITTAHRMTLSKNYEVEGGRIDRSDVLKGILYHFGYLEFTTQINIWTDSKEDRHDISEKIIRVLNPNVGVTSGLSLTLEQYYNAICRYDMINSEIADNEDSAIRNEWRFRIDLRTNLDILLSKDEYIAEHINLEGETQDITGKQLFTFDKEIT